MRTEARRSDLLNGVPKNRYVVFATLLCGGLALDLWSKGVVFSMLGYPHGQGNVTSFFGGWMTFRLFTSFNHGALWGIGQGWTPVFAILSAFAAAAVLFWLFVRGAARSAWLTTALGFVMAGALGNLYDRTGLHGYNDTDGSRIYAVRDFLLFTFGDFHWPVFNVADICLVTGAIMLVLQSLTATETNEESAPAALPATRA